EDAPGATGKGRNVKALIRYARDVDADELLLVDADLRGHRPEAVVRFVAAARDDGADLVLPLWRRPADQENTTKYLASPLVRAAFDARVRQPIAGQMLLGRALLATLDVDALPDDFGVDFAITVAALATGHTVAQVVVPSPTHLGRGPG